MEKNQQLGFNFSFWVFKLSFVLETQEFAFLWTDPLFLGRTEKAEFYRTRPQRSKYLCLHNFSPQFQNRLSFLTTFDLDVFLTVHHELTVY